MGFSTKLLWRDVKVILAIGTTISLSTACADSSPECDRLDSAVLTALRAVPWAAEVCDSTPCSVVIVDTGIYKTANYMLVPREDTVAFQLSGENVPIVNSDWLSFIPGQRWDGQAYRPDTAFASVGFSGVQPLDADSLLAIVQIIPPVPFPKWAYVGIRWEGGKWTVERFWMHET